MEKNILLTIEYDGSYFHGWQRQPDRRTVQGYLEEVISNLLNREIVLNGTSRTDAGVHAYGQRASFKSETGIPVDRLAMVINNALRSREKNSFELSPVRILSAEEKPADFHARFDAKGKKYIYMIRNTQDVDIFRRKQLYQVNVPLDINAMKKAAEYIKGTHDFKSFEASGGTPRKTTVRTIFDVDIEYDELNTGNTHDRDIRICISGDGFLYNMVRIITGTLVDIGCGKIKAEEIKAIIKAGDRRRAGHTAPPYGLYLAEVYY